MDIGDHLRGAFLKAADLDSGDVIALAEIVRETELAGETRLVLDTSAGSVVMNKTNMSACAAAWGTETDEWRGREVRICREVTNFQGRQTPCIRLHPVVAVETRPVRVAPAREVRPLPKSSATRGGPASRSDDIPF